jgi:hypothetical protein
MFRLRNHQLRTVNEKFPANSKNLGDVFCLLSEVGKKLTRRTIPLERWQEDEKVYFPPTTFRATIEQWNHPQ